MNDTDQGLTDDLEEAAFQRLEQSLAALRQNQERHHNPGNNASKPSIDPEAVLASLAVVEERLATLIGAQDRFAERNALTEAMTAVNGKIDNLTARLDARLNRLQESQTELAARLVQLESSPEAAKRVTPRPAYVLALLLLLLTLIAAAGAVALFRADVAQPDWLRRVLAEPARPTPLR